MKHRDRLIASVSILAITVIASPAVATHRHFDEPRNWTGEFFSGFWVGTYFADVNGDGKADAIAVDPDQIRVRLSDGCKFGPEQIWLSTPPWKPIDFNYNQYYVDFVDVDGDGTADLVVATPQGIKVRRSLFKTSHQNKFGPTEIGSSDVFRSNMSYFGAGIRFTDVDGDEKADAIAVNTTGIVVRRSKWDNKLGTKGFGPPENWTIGPYYGEIATEFADVDGDGKADAIAVNTTGIIVAPSTQVERLYPIGFLKVPGFSDYPENWTEGPYPSFIGSSGNFFANVLGDHDFDIGKGRMRADAIVVNDDGIAVRESRGRVTHTYIGDVKVVEPNNSGFLSPDPNYNNNIRVNQDFPQ